MSLIPTVYRSTDPGAPVLSGTAGSFAALMDAVLVNGYGTGPDAKPGLGWVRAFSDGHKRAYQNSLADGGTGMFWRIDDSNAQYVLNSCFHSMSGIDTGIDPFGHTFNAWGKSVTANTTARIWYVIGNTRTAYICIQNGSSVTDTVTYLVGDYQCFNQFFAFNFGISYSNDASVTSGRGRSTLLVVNAGSGASFMSARDYQAATIGSPVITMTSRLGGMSTPGNSSGGFPYPYPPTGGMLISKIIGTNGGYPFFSPPGLFAPEHSGALGYFQIYENIPGVEGGKFFSIFSSGRDGGAGSGLIRIDQPWSY